MVIGKGQWHGQGSEGMLKGYLHCGENFRKDYSMGHCTGKLTWIVYKILATQMAQNTILSSEEGNMS